MSNLQTKSPKQFASLTAVNMDELLSSSIKDDFPILHQAINGHPLVFLDSAASTQKPKEVIESLRHLLENDYANVHRGVYNLSERCTDLYENARLTVQRFLSAASSNEIVFTSGTTAGINLVARSWGDANVKAGDEIIVTTMEHHSNLVPWQQLAERSGAVLKHIPITDDGLLMLDALDTLLTERTKIVAVASVSNVLGTINPVREIVQRAHAAGAVVLIDAAQSVPHMATNVQEIGADFLVFSGHKMLAPAGIGILHGREELLDTMPPFLGGGSMIDQVWQDHFTPRELPGKFEAGTPPIDSAIALGVAIEYLNRIGMEKIARHEHELVRYAYERLCKMDGVRILGPKPHERSGLISFTLDGVHAHDLAGELDKVGIAVRASHHCAEPLHKRYGISASARASFYLYNNLDDVNALADAIPVAYQNSKPKGRKRRSRLS